MNREMAIDTLESIQASTNESWTHDMLDDVVKWLREDVKD